MVTGLFNHRTPFTPVRTSRVNNLATTKNAVFSISSQQATKTAQVVRNSSVAQQAILTPASDQSQSNGGAADFRQLFASNLPPAVPFSAMDTTATAAPANPPFVPTFQSATVQGVDNNGNTTQWALNHDYFATQESAQWLANKYGTGQLIQTPFEGSG